MYTTFLSVMVALLCALDSFSFIGLTWRLNLVCGILGSSFQMLALDVIAEDVLHALSKQLWQWASNTVSWKPVESQCPGSHWTLVTEASSVNHVRNVQIFKGKQVKQIAYCFTMYCVGRLSSSPQLDVWGLSQHQFPGARNKYIYENIVSGLPVLTLFSTLSSR
jgi:hypothetical protein